MGSRFGALLAGALALCLTVLASPAFAEGPAAPRQDAQGGHTWLVVDLDEDSLAGYRGGRPGLPPTSPRATGAARLDPDSPAARSYLAFLDGRQRAFAQRLRQAIPGAVVERRFDIVLGGAAVRVPTARAGDVAGLRGVRAVRPVELLRLATDTTPGLIGAEDAWTAAGGPSHAGEGVVVGVIDTGVWPEHPSLADPGPAGAAYPAPPAHWNGAPDACDFGNTGHNLQDAGYDCSANGKLLGASTFLDTYKDRENGLRSGEFDSARDADGHGTHVATTATGNAGVEAGALGAVSGIAPRSHLAVYKACGAVGCYSSDLLAAVDRAVADGVDVINYSVAGGSNPYGDAVSLAFLDAYEAGVVVATAAGNAGPAAGSVNHREPWTVTVAATSHARTFRTTLALEAAGGATREATGASVGPGLGTARPIVLAENHGSGLPTQRRRCQNPFAAGTFGGAIVVCENAGGDPVTKGENVLAGGAGAMVLYNPSPLGTSLRNYPLPTVHVEAPEGPALRDFVAAQGDVTATLPDPVPSPTTADDVAAFSGRGGPRQSLGISKPDVAAPGVAVLAGNTPAPLAGAPGHLFRVMQGTSMATPHVAGAAALVRQANPGWTPSEVRSALMLTALADGVTANGAAAGPFDAGSGRIRAGLAARSPLVMDEAGSRYMDLRDRLWDTNYPSVFVPTAAETVTLERAFRNTTGDGSPWGVTAHAPGVTVAVPDTLSVPAGGSATLQVTVDVSGLDVGAVAHGRITLERGADTLQLPVTVRRIAPDVTLDAACVPTAVPWGSTTDCTVEVANGGPVTRDIDLTVDVPAGLKVVAGSVQGGTLAGQKITFSGSVLGSPATVDAARLDNSSPAGYSPLSARGIAPLPDMSDEVFRNVALEQPIRFGGAEYDTIGVSSKGYVVLGGGDRGIDLRPYSNHALPHTSRPNNVLAPFWTDLDPGVAGASVRAGVVEEGGSDWFVAEWEAVPHWGSAEANSFQVWIGLSTDTAYFTYGNLASTVPWLTVGAENATGTSGGTVFHTPAGGDRPSRTSTTGYTVRVTATPGAPVSPHVLSFTAGTEALGPWTATATLASSAFAGVQRDGVAGTVEDAEATVPGRPRNLALTPGDRQITATWSAPASNGGKPITSYRVTANPGGHSLVVPASPRTATLTGLTNGTTYTVRVRARNEVGEGLDVSGTATPTAPPPPPPPPPPPAPEPDPDPEPDPAPEPDPDPELAPEPPGGITRLSGPDRFSTAAAVSRAAFEPGVPVAYVATGLNYPDALAGSAVAATQGGPVLLVTSAQVPQPTADELARLRPRRLVVLGGEGVVSAQVQAALRQFAPEVTRLSGPDRFSTAAAVSRAMFEPGVPVAYVATGLNYPDALAGSAVAAAQGGPVLLVTHGQVPPATADELARLRPERLVALGGAGVISDGVLASLGRFAPVERVAGPDRFSTAAATALGAFDSTDVVYVATGSDFPDALAGSAAAGSQGGPVLLTLRDRVPEPTAQALAALGPRRVVVLGGTGAVSNAVLAALAPD